MQKGFTHLVVLLFVISVLFSSVSIFYLTSNSRDESFPKQVKAINKQIVKPAFFTPTPVSTLLTLPVINKYQNQDLGFEFEYSQGFIVRKDSEEDFSKRNLGDFREGFKYRVHYYPEKVLSIISVNGEKDQNFFDNAPLTIWVFDNPNKLEAMSWYEKYWYYPFIWGEYDLVDSQKNNPEAGMTIGGEKAYYTLIDYQPGNPGLILVPLQNKMYLLRVLKYTDKNNDIMINTFKFLTN